MIGRLRRISMQTWPRSRNDPGLSMSWSGFCPIDPFSFVRVEGTLGPCLGLAGRWQAEVMLLQPVRLSKSHSGPRPCGRLERRLSSTCLHGRASWQVESTWTGKNGLLRPVAVLLVSLPRLCRRDPLAAGRARHDGLSVKPVAALAIFDEKGQLLLIQALTEPEAGAWACGRQDRTSVNRRAKQPGGEVPKEAGDRHRCHWLACSAEISDGGDGRHLGLADF